MPGERPVIKIQVNGQRFTARRPEPDGKNIIAFVYVQHLTASGAQHFAENFNGPAQIGAPEKHIQVVPYFGGKLFVVPQ